MKAQTLRKFRQYHNYIAVFFAPAILFFAFTGALQTAELHEPSGSYAPPGWIATIAKLHKHQTLAPHRHIPEPGDAAPATAPAPAPRAEPEHFIPVRPFVLLLAIALFVTTGLGLVIAVATPSTRRTSWILIAAGIVVPVVLLMSG